MIKIALLLFIIVTENANGVDLEINKCCQLNEQLDANFISCIPAEMNRNGSIGLPSPDDFWLPPRIREFSQTSTPLTIKTQVLQATGDVFAVYDAALYNSSHREFFTNFRVKETRTCYDASDNSSYPLVQKIALKLAIWNKCCKEGEQYNVFEGICEPRPGYHIRGELKEEIVNGTYIDHWAPFMPWKNRIIVVRYNFLREMKNKKLDHIGLKYPHVWRDTNVPVNEVETYDTRKRNYIPSEFRLFPSPEETSHQNYSSSERRNKSGIVTDLETEKLLEQPFCYDISSGYKDVFVRFSALQQFSKCCLGEEILSSRGDCVFDNKFDDSDKHLQRVVPVSEVYIFRIHNEYPSLCIGKKYEIKKFEFDDVEKVLFIQGRIDKNWNFYCYDWQKIGENNEYREVMGSCPLTPKVRLFNAVRPLGAVTALLLLVAVVVALIRKETRRSAHGRALACHAFCLAASNIIQVVWFFTSEVGAECTYYAYPIYYVMLAANVWLPVITGNMLYGFKNPLGAVATQREKHDDGKRRFVVMSAIAWGIPAIFTFVSILLHQLHLRKKLTILIAPTFFETRLCINESWDRFNKFPDLLFDTERIFIFLPLIYYYVPVILMVMGNIACVIYVAYKIRTLQKDKAFLHADHPKSSSIKQSVFLYVKLLLLAGVVELSLELFAYFQQVQNKKISEKMFATLENSIDFNVVATFVDLVRAMGVLWLCSGWRFRNPCSRTSRCGWKLLSFGSTQSSQVLSHTQDIELHESDACHVSHL